MCCKFLSELTYSIMKLAVERAAVCPLNTQRHPCRCVTARPESLSCNFLPCSDSLCVLGISVHDCCLTFGVSFCVSDSGKMYFTLKCDCSDRFECTPPCFVWKHENKHWHVGSHCAHKQVVLLLRWGSCWYDLHYLFITEEWCSSKVKLFCISKTGLHLGLRVNSINLHSQTSPFRECCHANIPKFRLWLEMQTLKIA